MSTKSVLIDCKQFSRLLSELNVSKYGIAKKTGLNWNTIDNWSGARGKYKTWRVSQQCFDDFCFIYSIDDDMKELLEVQDDSDWK